MGNEWDTIGSVKDLISYLQQTTLETKIMFEK